MGKTLRTLTLTLCSAPSNHGGPKHGIFVLRSDGLYQVRYAYDDDYGTAAHVTLSDLRKSRLCCWAEPFLVAAAQELQLQQGTRAQ